MADTENPGVFRRIDNFVRGVANGMTFGLADRMAAAGDQYVYDTQPNGQPSGKGYAGKLEQQNTRSVAAGNEGPESFAGEIAGGVIVGGGIGKTAITKLGAEAATGSYLGDAKVALGGSQKAFIERETADRLAHGDGPLMAGAVARSAAMTVKQDAMMNSLGIAGPGMAGGSVAALVDAVKSSNQPYDKTQRNTFDTSEGFTPNPTPVHNGGSGRGGAQR